ncbi:Hypothetical predicted protein, partial [Mytilus galloprovincialis]
MSRKIYFGGSISGGRDDDDLYARLIEQLRQYGTVLTEHVGNSSVEKDVEADVTQPSLGVGYEIGRAVDLKKTILCLFRPHLRKKPAALIRGRLDRELHRYQYSSATEHTCHTVLRKDRKIQDP